MKNHAQICGELGALWNAYSTNNAGLDDLGHWLRLNTDDLKRLLTARPEALRSGWIDPAKQFPAEGQEVRFIPLSGSIFNGWYTNALKTGNDHIDGRAAFVRGDSPSKILHASYTPSVVMRWTPLLACTEDIMAEIRRTREEAFPSPLAEKRGG